MSDTLSTQFGTLFSPRPHKLHQLLKNMSLPVPAPPAPAPMRPAVLPSHGIATVKSVLSGDTVVLTGRPAAPGQKAPLVIFTFERVTAPR